MGNTLVFVDHVEDGDAVQRAQVVRLPAGRGIEGGAVQIESGRRLIARDHFGSKIREPGIGVVKALCHWAARAMRALLLVKLSTPKDIGILLPTGAPTGTTTLI